MQLPEDFIASTRALFGPERWERYVGALAEEPPVSLRINPKKARWAESVAATAVPWCHEGAWLNGRPDFTFDPLFHAGCYYVQEAASMFVSHVLRQEIARPVEMLDLCAAPGGKSTAAISALPEGSSLVSNEPMANRNSVLRENIAKWGYAGCSVTKCYPVELRKSGATFDVILCDVPCSGEGMFRKDEGARSQWSTALVKRCAALQREIVGEAWRMLRPGGLLIYSTCTFNTHEDEENALFIAQEMEGATPVEIVIEREWGITGALLTGCALPVYRFIPGLTRSEGLFMCAFRKAGEPRVSRKKAKKTITETQETFAPCIDVDWPTAISYLRREAIILPPSAPRGIVSVAYQGAPLGLAKNIGTRANNLYPQEWRIRTTHLPPLAPQPIVIPTKCNNI